MMEQNRQMLGILINQSPPKYIVYSRMNSIARKRIHMYEEIEVLPVLLN